jgi:hypothetical protein
VKARIRLVLDYEVDAADMGLALDGAVLLADGDGPFRPSRSGAGCHVQRVGNAEVFSTEVIDPTDPSETHREGMRLVQGCTVRRNGERHFEFSSAGAVGRIWRRCNSTGWGADWQTFGRTSCVLHAESRDEAAEQACRAAGIAFGPHIIAAMDELSNEKEMTP